MLGSLDCLVSAIGVKLHAVAVRLHTDEFRPNIDEVGEIFTVPLSYLLNMEPTVGHLDIGTKPLRDFSVPFIRRVSNRLENSAELFCLFLSL